MEPFTGLLLLSSSSYICTVASDFCALFCICVLCVYDVRHKLSCAQVWECSNENKTADMTEQTKRVCSIVEKRSFLHTEGIRTVWVRKVLLPQFI